MEASKSHPSRSKGSNTTTTTATSTSTSTSTTTTTATPTLYRDLHSRSPRTSDNSSSSPPTYGHGHRVSRSTSFTSSQPSPSFTQHGYYRPSNLLERSSSPNKQHSYASHLNSSSSSINYSNRSSEQTPQYQQQLQLQTLKAKTTGLLAFAASAFGKNSGAKSSALESKLRHRQSSTSIISGPGQRVAAPNNDDNPFADPSPSANSSSSSNSDSRRPVRPLRQFSTQSSSSSSNNASPGYHLEGRRSSQSLLLQTDNPPSQPYSETDSSRPPPQLLHPPLSIFENKMHQTSSRLLRMTDDDRPFTRVRDFKDLFATLIVSLLPLSAHRVRLTKVEHTFLSEDAINNLGSLKFSQSNRMPDPKDPSRIVTTTTTTTFSMAKDMARAICQRFLDARFIESADGRYQQVYTPKGSVWQITPKGISILDQFCSKNGIQQKQVGELIGNMVTQLVVLERNGQTDKLVTDTGTIEVIFRRFVGTHGLNIKPSISAADSDSLNDYRDGITGVKMASERKVNGKTFKDTFTGKAACDWLMDCCSTVDRRETVEIANLFVEYDLIETIVQDRAYMSVHPLQTHFQPTKHAIYQLSSKGKELLNGNGGSRGRTSEGGDMVSTTSSANASSRNAIARDSNTQRLDKILKDPALRLLFRENLRETHCEENLSFYLDVDEFVQSCRHAVRGAQKNAASNAMDGVKEIMAQAYGIYNAFLAPGSPCELNIDHQLRNSLATRMTKAVGQDKAMIETLQEVTSLFEEAQNAVFKLMASDSVPKFLRSPKYEQTLRNYDFDSVLSGRGPERSLSRSNRK